MRRVPVLDVKVWTLQRYTDPTGLSGTGVVAFAAELPAGDGSARVALSRWATRTPPPGHPVPVHQTSIWASVAEIEAVHGHGGATELVPEPISPGRVRLVALSTLGLDSTARGFERDELRAVLVVWPDQRVSASLLNARRGHVATAEFANEVAACTLLEDWNDARLVAWELWPAPGGAVAGARLVRLVGVPEFL